MTRLTSQDLAKCPDNLTDFNERLVKATTYGLLELALMTAGMTTLEYKSSRSTISNVAVIPFSTGQGIINGFSNKVAQVISFLGLPCTVTRRMDVAGWGEAVDRGSEIVLCADDETFLAVNLESRKVVNNSHATGEIFAAALSAYAGDVTGQIIGVLGLGPVGRAASSWLYARGANLAVFDRDREKQTAFLSNCDRGRIEGLSGVDAILDKTGFVIDATNSGGIIRTNRLKKDLFLSAPGIPLGIEGPLTPMVHLIHEPLYMGVAAMVIAALN